MDILEFKGEYRWLSNFYPAKVYYGYYLFPSVEHAFQAAKAPILTRTKFQFGLPGTAKRLGRQQPLPHNWEHIKIPIMRSLLAQKFEFNSELGLFLQGTEGALVEGNTWGDTFWGMCDGQGQNILGRLLMERRNILWNMAGQV